MMEPDEMIELLQRVQTAILDVTDNEPVNHVAWATIGALAEMMALTNRTSQAHALVALSAMAAAMYEMLPPEEQDTVN